MKKDKEWLKEEINKVTSRVYGADFNTVKETDDLINQLEEPKEIELSEPSAWKTIAKLYHPNEVYWGNVRDSYIESLDEPEKVVVPQFVADRIEEYREIRFGLSLIFTIDDQTEDDIDFSKWLSADNENCEEVARAWIDGYTVEKEKRYTACFAPIGTRQGVYLYRESGSVKVGDNMKVYDKSKQEYHLTEQEIRNRDERFWTFAEEVTE